jgi:uncharacterized membrane protein
VPVWLTSSTRERLVDDTSELIEWSSFYVIVGSSAGALIGLQFVVLTLIVARRLRLQSVYRRVFEDWLFHVMLPLVAYAMLVVSAGVAVSHARPSLFLVGAATLLLLFVGIHNAWDAVTYHVLSDKRGQRKGERKR